MATERPQFEVMALGAEKAFVQVAGKETFDKEIMFALQVLRGSETLQKCNPQSIKNAVINIALTGATLNPALQQAFLVPRNIKGQGMSCCLDFSYRGLVKIATDSGSVLDIQAVEVFEGDEFYYEYGLTPVLKHVPLIPRKPGAKSIYVYAIAILHSGIKKFDVMTAEEVDKIRKTSQCPNSPAWVNSEGEMKKKTVVKRIYKLLPQTDRMGQAIHVVNEHEGLDPKNQGSGSAERLMRKFDISTSEDADFQEVSTETSASAEPTPSDAEKAAKEKLQRQKEELLKKEQGQPTSAAKGPIDAKARLKQLLAIYCEGDVDRMVEVLREISAFTTEDEKEIWIKSIPAIDKAKDGWVGSSISKLKAKIIQDLHLPEDCQMTTEGCQSASLDDHGLAKCVRTGADCQFQEDKF